MNSIWMKIAAVAVVLVVVLIVGSKFISGDGSTGAPPSDAGEAERPKTVYDSFERDDKEFGVDAQTTDEPAHTGVPVAVETPTQEVTTPEPAGQPVPPTPPAQPTFEKLSVEDDIQAQRLHSMALQERKRSRLPMMTPKLMVDYCREIIAKWPKSEYAFQAKRMLADIPERYKKMYNVTDQEMDVSGFYQ
jgi:hypothetical protein